MTTDLLGPVSMNTPDASVEGSPATGTFPVPAAAVPSDLLDGGEVVILAIKPSPWSVAFEVLPWVFGGAVLVALSPWLAFGAWTLAAGSLAQLVMAVVGLRLGLALLQWVSRVYVLTNRRVMRIRGVFRATIFESPLVKLINTGVTAAPHERAIALGSIWFNTGAATADGTWYHISRPDEIHAQIRRAVERSLDN